MKKVVLVLIIIGLIVPLFSFSWSGIIDADVSISGELESLELGNTDRFTFQSFAPFGKNIPMSITAEAFYEFAFSKPIDNSTDASLTHLVDLSVLQFTAQFPVGDNNSLALHVGRFEVYDSVGLIVDQQIDGAKIAYTDTLYDISTYVGFTGFLNGYTQTLFGVENENVLSDIYTFAPAFLLANINFRLPYLFDAQHAFALDLNGAIDITENVTTSNRFYATAGLQGPMGESFYYNVSSTLSFIMLEQNIIGNISVLELSSFLPFADSILSWKTVFATGGSENTYVPITEIMANVDSTLAYGGMVKTGLHIIMRPINSLFFLLGADAFFTVMEAEQDAGYTGIEWSFATRWDIASDVSLVGSVGNYFSNDPNIEPYLEANIALTIMF